MLEGLTVWKFELPERGSIEMPRGAKILHVEPQGGVPCLWALVDPEVERLPRVFVVVGTGKPVPPDAEHVATFQLPPFVWHVFEV